MVVLPRLPRAWAAALSALVLLVVVPTACSVQAGAGHPATWTAAGAPRSPGPTLAPGTGAALLKRDPKASPQARAVYQYLADLEAGARAGKLPGTVIGQHIEAQNELYNPDYGDFKGVKPVGYYYEKAADITGKLPGFVETDLGPGYGQSDWGVGNPRSYSQNKWPSCSPKWQYTDDEVDLLAAVWSGHPRAQDGTYGTSGTQLNCDGSTTTVPDNGGAPAGIVGMSFHEPYPGAPVKSFDEVLCRNSPAATDPKWFSRVVDGTGNPPEHQALMKDLSYVADHLEYFAQHDIPVIFRPYHEMNSAGCDGGFWWSGQKPADYQALWRTMYTYLVQTRGLHNLIFAWTPVSWDGAPGVDPWDYYPGDQYVDLVGVDDYSGSPAHPIGTGEVWTKRYYDGLAAYDKPRILAESFAVPVNSRQPDTLKRTPWTLWTVWGQSLTSGNIHPDAITNSNADVKATYNSPQAITGGSGKYDPSTDWSALHVR